MQEIYLDNSATTRVFPEVAEIMRQVMVIEYGNPSSLHGKGLQAERLLRQSRETIARFLSVKAEEIFFTSGGTEANNWAIKGVAYRRRSRGSHIITSAVEHASVMYSCRSLEKEGFSVTYLPVDREGRLDPETLKAALRPDTILVSIMHVNNEVGTVQPLAEMASIVAAHGKALFHVDGVQGFGKFDLRPREMGIDLLTISAHKLHGPKGIGALYLREGLAITPLLVGGEQEQAYRAGTENVPGIVGFARAVEQLLARRQSNFQLLRQIRTMFYEALLTEVSPVELNGSLENGSPHILNVSFPGVSKGEVLVHWLENSGVYVSTGSACHSRHPDPSHVLQAMQLKGERLTGAVRISFSFENSLEEVDAAVQAFKEAVTELRQLEGFR